MPAVPGEFEKAIDACHEHADELLSAAKWTIETDGLHHVGYHLSAVALEEVGKAFLLAAHGFAVARGKETPDSLDKHITDHVKKLEASFFGPAFGREALDREFFERIASLARTIEGRRRSALYVGPVTPGFRSPRESISVEQAEFLWELADKRLRLDMAETEARRSAADATADTDEMRQWFLDATDDTEKRQLIFGGPSMEKLAELGGPDWIRWLKQTFDEHESKVSEMLQKELSRPEPGSDEAHDHKWRLRVRFCSTSHTMKRQKYLNEWNEHVEWIKLYRVDRHPHQIDVDFFLPKRLHLSDTFPSGLDVSRKFLAALNISAVGGLFWWHVADHTARYFEKLTDLETAEEIEVERTPELSIDWGAQPVTPEFLKKVQLNFSMLMSLGREIMPIYHYLTGVTLLSKIDIHFRAERYAFQSFYSAIKEGMAYFGDWDPENSSPYDDAFRQHVGGMTSNWDGIERLIDIGEHRDGTNEQAVGTVSLEDVAIIKLLADGYFNNALNRIAEERLAAEEEAPEEA